MAETLMSAEFDARCGAPYRRPSADRVNRRNGYRERRWDTRVGTIALDIPKLRKGSYFPDWLLEPRRRSERALVQVVTECYVRGVSTRRVDGLVRTLGPEGMTKSQVSKLAKELDLLVEGFRNRPLDQGPYTFVWLDAMTQRCRDGGRVVNVVTVIATGVNGDGHREEILGLDVMSREDGAGWNVFLRGLVATLVRSVFAQPTRKEVVAQHQRVVAELEGRFPAAAALLDEAREEILAFSAFPEGLWRQIWSNNPQENREIRRRSDVVGIFPNRQAIVRLIGAVLAEYNDEWMISRRYMSVGVLKSAQQGGINEEEQEGVSVEQLAV